MDHIESSYKNVAEMTYAALNNHPDTAYGEMSQGLSSKQIQKMMERQLNKLSPIMEDKLGYRAFLSYLRRKDENGKDRLDHWAGGDKEMKTHLGVLAHTAGDSVLHGRYLTADDPTYGDRIHTTGRNLGRESAMATAI